MEAVGIMQLPALKIVDQQARVLLDQIRVYLQQLGNPAVVFHVNPILFDREPGVIQSAPDEID